MFVTVINETNIVYMVRKAITLTCQSTHTDEAYKNYVSTILINAYNIVTINDRKAQGKV